MEEDFIPWWKQNWWKMLLVSLYLVLGPPLLIWITR